MTEPLPDPTTEPDTSGSSIHDAAQRLATLTEALVVVAEAAAGYRRRLTEQGWSQSTAEEVALQVLVAWQRQVLTVQI